MGFFGGKIPRGEIGKVAFGKKKKRAAPSGASRYWNCVEEIATGKDIVCDVLTRVVAGGKSLGAPSACSARSRD
jgi:hypothetical protein